MPFSVVQTSGTSSIFFIFSQLPSFSLSLEISFSILVFSSGLAAISAGVLPIFSLWSSAHRFAKTKLGCTKAQGIFSPSPTTIICSIKREFLALFSIICGATYFPPDVLNISFLRSVMIRKPSSSINPMSPVLK